MSRDEQPVRHSTSAPPRVTDVSGAITQRRARSSRRTWPQLPKTLTYAKSAAPILAAASSCMVCVTWLYKFVNNVGSAWPRRSAATLAGTPLDNINVALVCRRPCAVNLGSFASTDNTAKRRDSHCG